MIEFCECGSIMRGGKCTNKNCPAKGTKRKGWLVGGAFLDFGQPVTYAEASVSADKIKKLQEEIRHELRR